MAPEIPSGIEVRKTLLALSHAQVKALSEAASVPFNTLWNIRKGETENPGIETVRKFMPFIAQVAA